MVDNTVTSQRQPDTDGEALSQPTLQTTWPSTMQIKLVPGVGELCLATSAVRTAAPIRSKDQRGRGCVRSLLLVTRVTENRAEKASGPRLIHRLVYIFFSCEIRMYLISAQHSWRYLVGPANLCS